MWPFRKCRNVGVSLDGSDFIEPDVADNLVPGGTSIEVTAEDWLQARTIWHAMGFRVDRFNQRRTLCAYIAYFRKQREQETGR